MIGCCLALILSCVNIAQGAIVDLIAYVSYSLNDSTGTPLADGSIVMIFGSTDAINNGPQSYNVTNRIADSTQGDDVYIGMVRIDGGGTFYTANDFSFDDSSIHYLYIRFFNATGYPVSGYYAWNTSLVFGFTSEFGKAEVDFVGNYLATVTNNFVVIPEPSTSHLFLVFFGLVVGLWSMMKKNASRSREPACKG